MRSRLAGTLGLFAWVSLSLAGCEYEWKEDPGSGEAYRAPANVVQAGGEESKKVKVEAPPPAEAKPVLAPGKDVSGQAALPVKAKKLDLTGMRDSGAVNVTANFMGGDMGQAFDEREDTLAKSEGHNPFKFTFEFAAPRTIKAVRVLSSYSDYGWAVQPDQGERLVVDTIIDGEWSTIAWPDGIKIQRITVEVLRKYRDNFVHLQEIELYE
ncbi:MAG: hypothetical protein ACK5GN_07355 [Pseudomonadota bacterium]